jgi:prepilin-type N-terminal cleavage/methylation domain-containing protein
MPKVAPARSSRDGGFSLVEMMVTIAVLGIALGIAIPSFRDFVASSKVKNAAYDLTAMLSQARSEATKRNANVAVELVSGAWSIAAPDVATGTVILRREAFSAVTLTCKTGPGCPASGVSWPTGGIIYASNGRLATRVTPAPAIDVTSTESGIRRCISIELSGQPRTTTVACP